MTPTEPGYFLTLMRQLYGSWGIDDSMLPLLSTITVAAGALLLSWLLYWLLSRYVVPLVDKVVSYTAAERDDIIFNPSLLRVVAELACVLLLQATLPGSLTWYPLVRSIAVVAVNVLFVCTIVHLINRFIIAAYALLTFKSSARAQSLQGIRQMLQVIAIAMGVIVIIAILANRNPLTIVTGLGAAATVLMLVFRDSIMGVVAGVQLTLNDMLRPGDWITVPSRNINGTVIYVGLTTVKVQNFDMTIVTVPPYSLTSESFQNWRGMTDSKGRRVNRAVTIDINSVRFMDPAEMQTFASEPWAGRVDMTVPQVNLTLFRHYLEHYISTLPELKSGPDMIHMVRELAPTSTGIPLEFYLFTSLTSWKPYEHFQAALTDRIVASVHRFGLRIYQAPSGLDILSLAPARS